MRFIPIIVTIIVSVVLLGLFIGLTTAPKNPIKPNAFEDGFISNEKFIDGLYNDLELGDSKQVFRYVFSRLEDEVIMYPTENYYYFTFTAQGKTIWGSMSLSAHDRDDGVFDFGYIEKNDKFRQADFQPVGGCGTYTAKDSVFVKKIDDFRYCVTFEEKTVVFKLNDVGLAPPEKAKLRDDEIFVGPSFDESGLKFFLIFSKAEEHLYWILNEDGFVPENFTHYTDDLVIGDRTGFAFYLDRENNRKILVGAEGFNVLQNNWYDGPFDQMPDNYVYTGQIEVKRYIEASYPNVKGRIDKYGNYLDEEGVRVAIAPYLVYFSVEDLVSVIESCEASALSKSQFYSCITQQVFIVPEDIYEVPRLPQMPPQRE